MVYTGIGLKRETSGIINTKVDRIEALIWNPADYLSVDKGWWQVCDTDLQYLGFDVLYNIDNLLL